MFEELIYRLQQVLRGFIPEADAYKAMMSKLRTLKGVLESLKQGSEVISQPLDVDVEDIKKVTVAIERVKERQQKHMDKSTIANNAIGSARIFKKQGLEHTAVALLKMTLDFLEDRLDEARIERFIILLGMPRVTAVEHSVACAPELLWGAYQTIHDQQYPANVILEDRSFPSPSEQVRARHEEDKKHELQLDSLKPKLISILRNCHRDQRGNERLAYIRAVDELETLAGILYGDSYIAITDGKTITVDMLNGVYVYAWFENDSIYVKMHHSAPERHELR